MANLFPQSFRTSPSPNTGLLDAEFEAFQAGNTLETGFPEPPRFWETAAPTPFQNDLQQPDWASDFQNMNLGNGRAGPAFTPQFHQPAHMQQNVTHAWHQDFFQYHGQPSRGTSQQSGPGYQSSFQNMPSYSHLSTPRYHSDEVLASGSRGKQKESRQDILIDDAAFERAFEEVQASSHDTQMDQTTVHEEQVLNPRVYADHVSGKAKEEMVQPGQYRLGSDRILDESLERGEEHNQVDEADELARTAGNLLENLKGDQSKKFQESNFLSLMRQLRDREVKVDGDRIVDNVSQYA